MRALVIESSTPHASVALVETDGVVTQRGFQSDRSHNALLFGPLAELLESRRPLDLVLVGSGPGSYSGTRVGIAAAQGVAIAMGCRAVALPSILAVPAAEAGAGCLAIGDARRGSYWTAVIDGLRLAGEPALCDAAELERRVSQAVAADFAVVCLENPGRFPLPAEPASRIRMETPDATRLWRAWQAGEEKVRREWSARIPQPLYLKPPHITPAKRALPAGGSPEGPL